MFYSRHCSGIQALNERRSALLRDNDFRISGSKGSVCRRRLFISSAVGASLMFACQPTAAQAQSVPPPAPNTLVSVCSGVSLPRSVVTGILDPVLTGIYGPIETDVNGILTILDPLTGLVLPSPLNVDVTGLLTTAGSGSNIGLNVLASDGTLVGPSSQCDATADSFTLDNPAGVSIGGNQITGLGDPGQQAVAGEIDSIAIGNRAATDPTAVGSIAIGPDANVGAGAIGSVAIGSGASATGVNSVALGAGSIADRDNSVSVGGRQITNVAAGTQPTDAANMAQLVAATADAVQYDDPTHAVVTLDGASGTTITNVAPGAVTAASTDAINGSQLFAVQTQVDGLQTQVNTNTTAITNLTAQVDGNSTAITNLTNQVTNGGAGVVQYSNPASPTVPNGGTPTNDATLVGAAPGPVGLHNVADGAIAAGSTDAVNGGQVFDLFEALPDSVADAVIYDDSTHTSITLNSGGASTIVQNVANGSAPTDAANVGQVSAAMNNAVNTANSYTDLQFDLLDSRIGRDRKNARAGTAAALAAAGMPQAAGEGRTMISGGVGTYGGRVGMAIGASHRASNGRSIYKVGVTYDSSEKVGASAGVGFEF